MKRLFLLWGFYSLSLALFSQSVGINSTGNDPDSSAVLDVQAPDKGMLMPRLTTQQRDAIVKPAAGLSIYNLDDSCFNYYTGDRWILDCGSVNEGIPAGVETFGGSLQDYGIDIGIDAAGNQYIIGEFSGSITLGSNTLVASSGIGDIFLVKLNPQGDVLWAIQGQGNPGVFGDAIATDDIGNSYILGTFTGFMTIGSFALTSNSILDVFVAKVSPSGQVLWATNSIGANRFTIVSNGDISFDAAGNAYISGSFRGSATFGSISLSAGDNDLFVAKLNSAGQFTWAIQAGGIQYQYGTGITTDAAGNSIVVGSFQSNANIGGTLLTTSGPYGIFATKISPSGQYLWANTVGEDNNPDGTLYKVATDPTGNSYITGPFGGTQSFGGTILTSNGQNDVFITKYSPTGQFEWATQVGGAGEDYGRNIVVDGTGNSYLTGVFSGTVLFGSNSLTSSGNKDIFATKVNPSGQFLWARKAGGGEMDQGNGISLGPDGTCSVTGYFRATANFGITSSTSQGEEDFFAWTLNTSNGEETGSNISLSKAQIQPPDNLGNHTATQALQLGANYLSGDGDNEGIFINATGNVGIGINTPQHLLDFGPGVGRRLALAQNSAGTDFYGFAISPNTLEIHASSTPAEDPGIVLKLDGKVGMGTTSPQSRLDVEGGLAVGSTYAGTSAAPADGAIIEGNVGIGTNNPTQAKVVISGSTLSLIGNPHGWLNSSGAIAFPGVRNLPLSLWASNGIAALEFIAFSDARIKDIHGISDSEADLATLMQLEITDYRMKDTLAKGTAITKKVIAQQVAEVYPQAVTTDLTEVIPDIYQRAEVQDGWILLSTDLQPGERVKLITEQSAEVYEVLQAEPTRFQVAQLSTQNSELSTVFVYGREVDDFHTVDYEAISMLNVSATQEQQRRIEAQQAEIQTLKAQLQQSLQSQKMSQQIINSLEARLEQIEQKQELLSIQPLDQ